MKVKKRGRWRMGAKRGMRWEEKWEGKEMEIEIKKEGNEEGSKGKKK